MSATSFWLLSWQSQRIYFQSRNFAKRRIPSSILCFYMSLILIIFQVFVLKLKAPEQRDHSPEVIVKTTRKIFSPVVRSGESVPRAVIPVDVEDLAEVRPSEHSHRNEIKKKEPKAEKEKSTRSKSSGDLQEVEELKKRTRPPLPSSPSSQRKPQPKETAPSIRIMIQRYNKKINEDGEHNLDISDDGFDQKNKLIISQSNSDNIKKNHSGLRINN